MSPPVLVSHEDWTCLGFPLEQKSMRSNMTSDGRYEWSEPFLPVKCQDIQTNSVLVILGKGIVGEGEKVIEN